MASRKTVARAKALAAIQKRGALLVYPLKGKREPLSIWSELYPRSEMVWDWDVGADDRVSATWILREELSRTGDVVYAKWFQGRATFFSLPLFTHLLAFLRSSDFSERLAPPSAEALDILLADSPLSTKQLKAALSTEGRMLEPAYNRLMKPLWQRLLVVGFGELDDSSFPSLRVGASATLFEDCWRESLSLSAEEGEAFVLRLLGEENPFYRFARKLATLSLSAGLNTGRSRGYT